MKFCYFDESGTGSEPIAVMTGVVADAQRMHLTKVDWASLLEELSNIVGKPVSELHTRDFYPGNGVWRGITGLQRAKIITEIFAWIEARKHRVVYSAIEKSVYEEKRDKGELPEGLGSIWRTLGFHVTLALQKAHGGYPGSKGHTVMIFDSEYREEARFADLLRNPPAWSDEYYGRKKKQRALDQIVDVPYFGDSEEVALIQLSDFLAFFLRRYIEIEGGFSSPKYAGEDDRLRDWIAVMGKRSIGSSHIYPKKGRTQAAEFFFSVAPEVIRDL